MYEEEDDDLPLQYRRLTAHLQTSSGDFNRRLAAYLTNQVAMRSAMDQMINNSYAQQFPNAAQFNQNHPYPSPMVGQNMVQSPTNTYRAAPYPSPHRPGFRQQVHGRSFSAATPNEMPTQLGQQPISPTVARQHDHRSMSTPSGQNPAMSQTLDTEAVHPDPEYQRQTQSASTVPPMGSYAPLWQDMGPFTTSLPPESQQMLGSALDPMDPFSSMLMAGSENMISNSYYPWGALQMPAKPGMSTAPIHPSYNGMSATLAPSALDVCNESLATTTCAPAASDSTGAPAGLDFNFSQDSNTTKVFHGFAAPGLTRENSAQGLASGQMTPAEGFWDSFVQDGGWADENPV